MCRLRVRALTTGILLLLFLSASVCWAQDPLKERAWFEDDTGQRSLDDARHQPFTPFTGLLSRGFGDAPIWVRLLIAPRAVRESEHGSPEESLILRITPSQLDEIELFDPLDAKPFPRRTGDRFAWSDDEAPSLYFSFVVPRGDTERYVWLRVKTSSSRLIGVEALTVEGSRRYDMLIEMLSGAYLGVLVLFLGWALNIYFNAPERLLGLFVLKQLGAVVYALFVLGYMRLLLEGVVPPLWVDSLSSLCLIIYSLVALCYHLVFFKLLKPPPWTIRLFTALILMPPAALYLQLSGQTLKAMMLTVGVLFVASLLGMLMTLLSRYPSTPEAQSTLLVSKRSMVVAHLLLLASVLVSALPVLGLFDAPMVAVFFPLSHALLSGLVMMWILQVRALRLARRQASAQAQFQAMHETMKVERSFREEQQHLLAMLAHELKTPLAAISMLTGKANPSPVTMNSVKLAVNEMTLIVDRCVQAGRMDDAQQVLCKTRFDPLEVLQQLIKARPVSEQVVCHGRGGVLLHSDEQMVRMLLSNLLENACRYGPAGEEVHVWLTPCAEDGRAGVRICFENQPGPAGWPDPKRVFSKYYRSPHAHRQTGSGLGLYLVAGFASRLGGLIRYVPIPHSIRFELWLPL